MSDILFQIHRDMKASGLDVPETCRKWLNCDTAVIYGLAVPGKVQNSFWEVLLFLNFNAHIQRYFKK